MSLHGEGASFRRTMVVVAAVAVALVVPVTAAVEPARHRGARPGCTEVASQVSSLESGLATARARAAEVARAAASSPGDPHAEAVLADAQVRAATLSARLWGQRAQLDASCPAQGRSSAPASSGPHALPNR